MVPTVALPPAVVFTSQLTEALETFCTVAVNFTVVPVKGRAEVGDTITVITGDGPEEEETPPHEIKDIHSRRTRKNNDRPEHSGGVDRPCRGR